jgi:hypothetical protein
MKAWGRLNSLVKDVQQSKSRDVGERESCVAGKPIAMVELPGFPASRLPGFYRLLL